MVIPQGEAIQQLETPHEVQKRVNDREDSKGGMCYVDGRAIPLVILPPAHTYPKQTHWTWTDTNVRGEETSYLAYLPSLSEKDVVGAHQLPAQYDLTVVRPVDGPRLKRWERKALRIMRQVTIPVTFCEELLRRVNKIKARRRRTNEVRQPSEGRLIKGLLRRTTTDELQSWQLVSLLKITRMAEKVGDSILRLLRLYSARYYKRPSGRWERIGDLCVCKNKPSLSLLRRSIANYFWTESELYILANNISIAKSDYCALARLIPRKTCRQIKDFLSRHGASTITSPSWIFQACCTCVDGCDPRDCPCRQKFHECSLTMTHRDCSNACMGQRNDKWAANKVCIRPSPIAGWGCFARAPLPASSFVMEYTGEVISQEEAERRGFWCDLQNFNYFYELDDNFIVDATYTGTAMRFCNHSSEQANVQAEGKSPHNPACKANLYLLSLVLVLRVNEYLRVGIFTKRAIAPGEEILLDYGEFYVRKLLQGGINQVPGHQNDVHDGESLGKV